MANISQTQRQEFIDILMAEYRYWRDIDTPNKNLGLISIGAVGAISNVITALHGHQPTHHKGSIASEN